MQSVGFYLLTIIVVIIIFFMNYVKTFYSNPGPLRKAMRESDPCGQDRDSTSFSVICFRSCEVFLQPPRQSIVFFLVSWLCLLYSPDKVL